MPCWLHPGPGFCISEGIVALDSFLEMAKRDVVIALPIGYLPIEHCLADLKHDV
jgi:hypothetical protein